jgi:hypothetical protein
VCLPPLDLKVRDPSSVHGQVSLAIRVARVMFGQTPTDCQIFLQI